MNSRLTELTLIELTESIHRGEVKAEEVVEAYLSKINEKEPQIKAFITVTADLALEQAKKIDNKKEKGKLAGAPLAIKDNILTAGIRTTCASRILENYIPPYNATVVNRLLAEDALIIGKTNLDEFAMGSSTENSAFFPTRNPYDINRVPGGSSGGSAAAVASGEAVASLGSDTGGSIRQPAAFCNLVGLKPTYGRVSRYGLVAFASSLDQIGPLTRTVEDAALMMEVIAGYDPHDSTSASVPVPSYRLALKGEKKVFKIGYLPEEKIKEVTPEIKSAYFNLLNFLEREGFACEALDLKLWDYALPCYYLIAPSEASSNLARYDGIRYGFRYPGEHNLKSLYALTRTVGFGPEVKRRILLGTFALSAGYYEAYYGRARHVRYLIKEEFRKTFASVDVILTPTTPEPPFYLGAKVEPISMYLSDYFTVAANLAGLPAISLPMALTEKGLPLGLQIMAPPFEEERIFWLAFFIEKKVKSKRNIFNWKEEK
ncbi:MAG: Asp-tRNA(Asn)/Glu-tRNA(Gln) amidotransferase subunit GatA [Candidatus Aminicenantes bacterium]|nr:Asp-tRNA(Asn)/Glu-tRNA(Gln) amidotransferase subunit GatA [Candidatus Aminicenantes bacterium]